jgi:hypothetical protein
VSSYSGEVDMVEQRDVVNSGVGGAKDKKSLMIEVGCVSIASDF